MLAEGHIGKCGVNPVCVAQGFQAGVCVSAVGAGEGILGWCTVAVEIEQDRDLWAERQCIEDLLFIPHLASLHLLCEKTGSFPMNGYASNYLLTSPELTPIACP